MTTLPLPCRTCKHATEHELETWGNTFIGSWAIDLTCAKGIKPKFKQGYEMYGANTKETGEEACDQYDHIPQHEVFG
jgi:hypothetical protein